MYVAHEQDKLPDRTTPVYPGQPRARRNSLLMSALPTENKMETCLNGKKITINTDQKNEWRSPSLKILY